MSTENKNPISGLKLRLSLKKPPEKHNFKRFLLFKNENGKALRMPVKFSRGKDGSYRATAFPEGLDALNSITEPGNRTWWDSIWLENRNGKVGLEIDGIEMVLDYGGLNGSSPGKITFIKYGGIQETLDAGMSRFSLNRYAFGTKYKAADLHFKEPEVLRVVIRDIGKYGSDTESQKDPNNPKYGEGLQQGSPEFVAWYYHECGVKSGRRKYHRKKYGVDLRAFFRGVKKLHSYHPSKGGFYNTETRKRYKPKPGDFIQSRAKDGKAMIVLNWDAASGTLRGITGPFPVVIETITLEKGVKGDGYWLGAIS